MAYTEIGIKSNLGTGWSMAYSVIKRGGALR